MKLYTKILSPIIKALLPNYGCRFTPTCSQYASLAIKKHGVLLGGLKAIWRIFRCNPLTKGGYDYP